MAGGVPPQPEIQIQVHSRKGGNSVYPVEPATTTTASSRGPAFYREIKHFKKWFPWLIPSFVIVNVVTFLVTMYVNNCPHNSVSCNAGFLGRFSFQPFSENPLLGPSSTTLEKMGALDVNKVVHEHQGWRLITCMWLHGGVFHLLANMLSLLVIGIRLEREFGFVRIGVLYIIAGLGGSLFSALFIKSNISVGASGALFGLLGSMLSELIINWTIYANKIAVLVTLVVIIIINLAVGLLPHVDNFAHIGGFVSGFLLGFVFLIRPQFGWVSQRYASRTYSTSAKPKFKMYQMVLWVVSLILLIIGFTSGLVMLFRGVDLNDHCSWCHYMSCLPTSKWSCNTEPVSCMSEQTSNQLTLTCSNSNKTRTYPLSNPSTSKIQGLCTHGRWVLDNKSQPLYESCPYIQPQLTCQQHGRLDKEYLYWRWQPHSCSIPSFNATLMLESLRGKRMLFVGDSLNRGQFVSMVCLLHRLIPDNAKSMETFGSLTVFTAKDYNARIEYYWAPFLLESNADDAVIHRITDRVVRKGSINKHGKKWKGADIIVFNTYLWWMTGMPFKILQKGSFKDEVKDIVEMSTEDAYRMTMKSMLRWVKNNMDSNKSRVFFTSMSPSHYKSMDWGGEADRNCYNETKMIEDPSYWGSDCSKSIMRVIGEVFSKSEVHITFLNITQLSSYRKDAHTSIYKKQWNPLTPEQLANPVSYADCTHWCLPGLQDTWNELLFAKLFYP